MKVTIHAAEQYSQRQGHKEFNFTMAERAILKMVARARRIDLPPEEATRRLLNNGCEEVEYFYDHGFVFVVSDGSVVTCYPYKLNAERRKALHKC